MKKSNKQIIGIIIVSLLVTAGLYGYFQYRANYPQTDDAYVQTDIVPISSQVSGKVSDVYARNNEYVKQDQVLFSLSKTPYHHAVDEAEASLLLANQTAKVDLGGIDVVKARLKSAQATLASEKKNYQRIMSLVQSGQAAKAKGDEVTASYEAAKASADAINKQLDQARHRLGQQGSDNAKVKLAQARLNHALMNLQYTEIKAPANGYPTKVKLRPGTAVNKGQPLFYFVEDHCWWVEANFKETQLQKMKPGQPATIKLDMYPNKILHGFVDSISHGSGAAFSMLPPENATGNWVKVTQRFPVKIVILDVPKNIDMRVGSSAEVTVDTKRQLKIRNPCNPQ